MLFELHFTLYLPIFVWYLLVDATIRKNMFLHVLFALIAIVLLKLLASFVMQSSQINYQEG